MKVSFKRSYTRIPPSSMDYRTERSAYTRSVITKKYKDINEGPMYAYNEIPTKLIKGERSVRTSR